MLSISLDRRLRRNGISIDKNLQRKDFEKELKISPSTIAKMGRGEFVAMTVLLRLCEYLACNIGDIVSFDKE